MKIISNTAVSLDGRINLTHNRLHMIGSDADRRQMQKIRCLADAFIVGGQTFRLDPRPIFSKKTTVSNPVFNFIISDRLDFKFPKKYLLTPEIIPIVLTSNKNIPKNFPVLVIQRNKKITADWISDQVKSLGVKTLLIEGGGKLLHLFLKDNLLNEMYLTLTPRLISNPTAPLLINGDSFGSQGKSLKLLKVTKKKDELFLRYGVKF